MWPVEYAHSRGHSLDPKDLKVIHGMNNFGDIRPDQGPGSNGPGGVEA